MLFFLLVASHFLFDYPLQGDFLARQKGTGTRWSQRYHTLGHSIIHGGAVALLCNSLWLGVAETVIHYITDRNKVRGNISYLTDQTIHISCKVLWVVLVMEGGAS